ncbi:TorF family putative porin [Pseudoduganella sp. OTU4001]|uniref:TorF family putative porin n=1 Tax=Pseudoduganella sp. OTU4001 TaxID=3043854 RepID=UPI00313C5A9E
MSQSHRQPGPYALTGLACLFLCTAQAQVSGSAGLVSDHMYRGMSLSSGKPAARLSLDIDDASGWFAGGQVVSGQLAMQSHRTAQWLGYAGYARRLESGLSWEAGISAYAFHGVPGWNFREVFAGLSFDNYSARLHYAPDYLGFRERTLYAELNGGGALTQDWRYFWRAGYLSAPGNADSSRAEGRLGIGTSLAGWQVQLSIEAARLRGRGGYDAYGRPLAVSGQVRGKTVLGVARGF